MVRHSRSSLAVLGASVVALPFLVAACSLLVDTRDLAGVALETGPDAHEGDGRDSSTAIADAGDGDTPAPGDATVTTDSAGPPAISFVQARELSTPTGTSLPITFGSAVSAHHAIIVCISIYTTAVTLTGITDTRGNAYTTVMGPLDGNGTRHYIAAALDVAAGPDTVTVTVSGNPSPYLGAHIHEYAGLATSNAFDVGSFGVGISSAVDGMASGVKTTTADHELIFGYGVSSDTAYPGTGFTARSGFSTGDVTEDIVVTKRGPYQATATMVSGTHWEILMATFKGQ